MGLVLGGTKTSNSVPQQHVLMLSCLISMVLPSKPCPAPSHSCGPTGMEQSIQPFGKVSSMVSRSHLFPCGKVLGSFNEQNTTPSWPKMSHFAFLRGKVSSYPQILLEQRNHHRHMIPATTDDPVTVSTFSCLSFKPVLNKSQAFFFFY